MQERRAGTCGAPGGHRLRDGERDPVSDRAPAAWTGRRGHVITLASLCVTVTSRPPYPPMHGDEEGEGTGEGAGHRSRAVPREHLPAR